MTARCNKFGIAYTALTCVWYKVICEPVSAGLLPREIVRNVGARPNRKGIPSLAGYWGITVTESAGKTRYCCVGSFPEARPAYWEAPETLRPKWVFISGETDVRGMWAFPRAWLVARKTGVPWTRWITVFIGLLLYKLGLSANSQEALFRALGVQ